MLCAAGPQCIEGTITLLHALARHRRRRIENWSLIVNETNDQSISRSIQQTDYDNPTILPVSRSMSISMKAGCVANPGIVLIVPISG